jgi:hypothetical protein
MRVRNAETSDVRFGRDLADEPPIAHGILGFPLTGFQIGGLNPRTASAQRAGVCPGKFGPIPLPMLNWDYTLVLIEDWQALIRNAGDAVPQA